MSYNSKYKGAEVEAKLDKIDSKQDAISDLDEIRSGAAKGATALQEIPAEYVTETELNEKGYATTSQLADKQDTITDLETIRSGAEKGATALHAEDLAKVATSGSYNDLTDKPTIPDISGKQDTLVSGKNIKTINGEPILGSGNIEIGGGEVYITPFTAMQFHTGLVELTDEQLNELINAASQNKIIGMPHGSDYQDYQAGYIIADYKYGLSESDDTFWSLDLGVIYNGAHYSNNINSNSGPYFRNTLLSITSFSSFCDSVTVEDGAATVSDVLGYPDNCIFWVLGECTELYIVFEPSEIGKTVRFFTGESCTLEIAYPVYWANGEVPTIEPYTHYELSLVTNMDGAFNAVLTPFKQVE